MSFGVTTVGKPADVLKFLDSDPGPLKPHGGALGVAFRDVIAQVAESGLDKPIYVEASGHGDGSSASLDVKIRTVHTPALPVTEEAAP